MYSNQGFNKSGLPGVQQAHVFRFGLMVPFPATATATHYSHLWKKLLKPLSNINISLISKLLNIKSY